MADEINIGVIGGSGLYGLAGAERVASRHIDTPFGSPSSEVTIAMIHGVNVAFISRHGSGHYLAPTEVPYAANIYALKSLGVSHLLSVSAVGSLREEIAPRSFCVPNDAIDRTVSRPRTFFGDGIVAHVSLADPFCLAFADQVAGAATNGAALPVHRGGTYVSIEGPQFSTRAESQLFRNWGADIIGMTALPEARFAREAELCYACLATVTDYDVWHSADDVSVEIVVANLQAMTDQIGGILDHLVASPLAECGSGCQTALDDAVITDPDVVPEETWRRLGPITARYVEKRLSG